MDRIKCRVLESGLRPALQINKVRQLVLQQLFLSFLIVNFKNYPRVKNNLLLILALLVTQVVLGIMNVVLSLPMLVAVLHNAVALGLLLSLIGLLHKIVNNPKA